jgi:hypothetical protein
LQVCSTQIIFMRCASLARHLSVTPAFRAVESAQLFA